MIVNRHSLNVMPVADRLMQKVAGQIVNEVEQGKIAWSNELVMHVIELKTNGPTAELETLPALFLENIRHINTLLDDMDACLMPTAMHPWMNPYREKVLWPHDSREIYDTYDRIFNCEGHGWCNLQSMHINLPFANDSEFARLHAAIRILLPILPALAASSPIVEGRVTSILDTRLETYRVNSIKIPSITGQVIPEPIISGQQYQQQILAPMYRDIAPFDPEHILQEEWLNSRGAIARFDRNAIEIRVIDTQETPAADLAIASFVIQILKKLTGEDWTDTRQQNTVDTAVLAGILRAVIIDADETVIDQSEYLELFRYPGKKATARELLLHIRQSIELHGAHVPAGAASIIDTIIAQGPLARRILRATGGDARRTVVEETYRTLCQNLVSGELFEGIS